MNENPYQAPSAELDVPAPELGGIHAPRGVPSGRGMAWFSEGWRLFMQAPAALVLIGLVFVVLWGLVSLVPLLGSLAVLLFWPHAMAGLFRAAARARAGESVPVGTMFGAFQDVSRLLGVGGLYLLGAVLLGIIMVLGIGMSGFMAAMSGGEVDPATLELEATGLSFLVAMLLVLLLMIPYIMAFLFAPLLADRHGMKATEAVKQSFQACLRNIGPFFIWSLVWFGVMILAGILAVIPILGFIVLALLMVAAFPLSICNLLVAYEDIFVK